MTWRGTPAEATHPMCGKRVEVVYSAELRGVHDGVFVYFSSSHDTHMKEDVAVGKIIILPIVIIRRKPMLTYTDCSCGYKRGQPADFFHRPESGQLFRRLSSADFVEATLRRNKWRPSELLIGCCLWPLGKMRQVDNFAEQQSERTSAFVRDP